MRQRRPARKQHTSEEIRDELLNFIRNHFYKNDYIAFLKDRPRLLKLVVLKFAEWLDERGVSLHPDRYLKIMRDSILMEAVRFGHIDEIKYPPAWLGVFVENHLSRRGEAYYEEGKSIRNICDTVISFSRTTIHSRDPIRELAQASKLLVTKRKSTPTQPTKQLALL